MVTSPKPQSTLDDWRELLVDFGLPTLVLFITAALIWSGRDGEIKTLFVASVAWLIKSGVQRRRK